MPERRGTVRRRRYWSLIGVGGRVPAAHCIRLRNAGKLPAATVRREVANASPAGSLYGRPWNGTSAAQRRAGTSSRTATSRCMAKIGSPPPRLGTSRHAPALAREPESQPGQCLRDLVKLRRELIALPRSD